MQSSGVPPWALGTAGAPEASPPVRLASSEDFPVLAHPCSAPSPPGWGPGQRPARGTREGAGTPKTLPAAGAGAPTEPPVPPGWAGPGRRRDPDLPPTLPWHSVAAAPAAAGSAARLGRGCQARATAGTRRGQHGDSRGGQGDIGRGQRAGAVPGAVPCTGVPGPEGLRCWSRTGGHRRQCRVG